MTNLARLCLIAFLSALITAYAEAGTKCKCETHLAEAEATGTCSRTEDKNYCTLVFTTTPQTEYQVFVNRLRKLGLNDDPRKILEMAYKMPPQSFNEKLLRQALPILFAISQRTYFQEVTADIAKAFGKQPLKEIQGAYQKEGTSVIKTKLGPFNATVSYGCIELKRGDLATMVKTRWSKAEFFCHDFKK